MEKSYNYWPHFISLIGLLGCTGKELTYEDAKRDKNRTQIPRHIEIVDELARKIWKNLNIPLPE